MVDTLTPSLRLFENTERFFSTNGICALKDTIRAEITEELNGVYELELEYPIDGTKLSEIKVDRIICTKPNPYKRAQPFRIYDISKEHRGVITVKAEHISYDLSEYLTGNIILTDKDTAYNNPLALWSLLTDDEHLTPNSSVKRFPFTFTSEIESTEDWFGYEPSETFYTLRSAIFSNDDDSLFGIFGGEFDYDGYTIMLKVSRGEDNGVVINYGNNLINCVQEESSVEEYTGVMPFWSDKLEDETIIKRLPEIALWKEGTERFKVYALDVTDLYDESPSDEQLREAGNAWLSNPDNVRTMVNVTVEFINLKDSAEYEELKNLETVNLGDTITVNHTPLHIKTKSKIIKTVYNAITGKYTAITIGDSMPNLISSLSGIGGSGTYIINGGGAGGRIKNVKYISPTEFSVTAVKSDSGQEITNNFKISSSGSNTIITNTTNNTTITFENWPTT